jgi:hypothetical protein
MSSLEVTPVGPRAVAPIQEEMPGLIRVAIENNLDVEKLERLIALQERVMERSARMAFFEALASFRNECPPIRKTRENTQFQVTRAGVRRNGMYAPLEEIDRVARPVAAKHGLGWTWDTRVDDTLMHVTCRVIHVDGHTETTNVSMPFESKAGSSVQQKYGSCQTYGMRYSLIAALGITTVDEDDDGNGSTGGEEVQKINQEQVANLTAMADEILSPTDRVRFLRFMCVDAIEDIPASEFQRAFQAIENKRRPS